MSADHEGAQVSPATNDGLAWAGEWTVEFSRPYDTRTVVRADAVAAIEAGMEESGRDLASVFRVTKVYKRRQCDA